LGEKMLWTCYLGFFKKLNHDYDDALFDISEKLQETHEVKSVIPYFTMLNRGNNEVAPTQALLERYKEKDDWEGYKKEYLESI